MNLILQEIAKNYYQNRTEKNFLLYYQEYKEIAAAAAWPILRDRSQAQEVVNDLFTKFHSRDDDSFVFDDKKSHVGYVWHSASNLAKIKWNRNRIKVNNLNNCGSRADHRELEYMSVILANESENIKVSLGFSRYDYLEYPALEKFCENKLVELEGVIPEDACGEYELDMIDDFFNTFGCTTTVHQRIKKSLKIKKKDPIRYEHLLTYVRDTMDKVDRMKEIDNVKSIDDITKIKSKATRKKFDKILFENTKVNLLVCESSFKDDNDTGDTLEYLGYVNGGNYEIDSELGSEQDVIFGAGNMSYSTQAQLDFAKEFIKNNDDKETQGLLYRVLVDNLKFKVILEDIIHVIKLGEKDYDGHTMADVEFCRNLVMSADAIPAIIEQAKAIDISKATTQEEYKSCMVKFRDIITAQTQLKCAQDEYGFNSVGAIKSRSHRTRKYLKEEFGRKMIISEITENKRHQITGKVVDKFDTGEVKMECVYKSGILNGSMKIFYKSGSKKIVQMYKSGKLDGDYREFYENGKPKVVGQYVEGLKVGAWSRYREDGSKDELGVIDTAGNIMFELYDKHNNVEETGMIRANEQ